jgi:LacI family transcriptional regulator
MITAPQRVRRPTIKEVAKLAGVSFKTVARVVNKEPNVNPDRRDAVLRAMKLLNYSPNISARQLAGRRSFLIALLFDIPETYVARAQSGAITRCREAGYHLIVEEVPQGFEVEIANRLEALNVDGVILTPPVSQRESLRAALRERGLRHVLIGSGDADGSTATVGMNDRLAAQQMTELLIGLGHREIAFVTAGERRASVERQAGYVAALEAAGIARRPALEREGRFSFESGEAAGRELLQASPRPSAIFAANDAMALGVMTAAARLGVPIPDQLSVAGFDDTPAGSIVWPQLTTVRQPLAAMAATAVDLLLEREPAGEPASIILDFEILRRGSVGPAPDGG